MTHHSRNHMALSVEDEWETYEQAYVAVDLELLKRQNRLKATDDIARRQRDAQFPASVAAFRAVPTKDAQVKCTTPFHLTTLHRTQSPSICGYGRSHSADPYCPVLS